MSRSPPLHFTGTAGAIIAAHVFFNTALVVRLVGDAWAQMHPRVTETAAVLGAGPLRRWHHITMPLLSRPIIAAALLVFLFDFTSFGVVLLLGAGRFATLEVEIYLQTVTLFDLRAAALLSLLQLLLTALVTSAYSSAAARSGATARLGSATAHERWPVSGGERLLLTLTVGALLVLLVVPMAALALRALLAVEDGRLTLALFTRLGNRPRGAALAVTPLLAIRNSLLFAAATALLSLAVGLPAAKAAIGVRRAWVRRLVDIAVMLPLGTSPVTIGFGFILALGLPGLDTARVAGASAGGAYAGGAAAGVPLADRGTAGGAGASARGLRSTWCIAGAAFLARGAAGARPRRGQRRAIRGRHLVRRVRRQRPDRATRVAHYHHRDLPLAVATGGQQLRPGYGAGDHSDADHGTQRGGHRTAARGRGARLLIDMLSASDQGATPAGRKATPPAALEVRRVSVQLGGAAVLADVSLTASAGEIVALLGPSGCGKTTLLRVIGGLQPHTGAVHWQGQSVVGVPAHRRGFGLVFQDQALFPHLDVAGNVGFGLRMQGGDAAERARQVTELLHMVGLSGLTRRSVDSLSGGEAQRVALARALAPRPRLLMLDEPLSGLDRPLREQLLIDLPLILRRLRQTALFVTHDLEEALAVSDRVAVMQAGRIVQVDTPRALYERPASVFVARFIGRANILRGTVRARAANGTSSAAIRGAHQWLLETDVGLLPYDHPGAPGDRGTVLIRPERITLVETNDPAGGRTPHTLSGTLQDTSFRGIAALATVLVRNTSLQVLVPAGRTLPATGATVTISFDPHAAVVPLADDR